MIESGDKEHEATIHGGHGLKCEEINIRLGFHIPSFKNSKEISYNPKTKKRFLRVNDVKGEKMKAITNALSLSHSTFQTIEDETLTGWLRQSLIAWFAPEKSKTIKDK